MAKYNQICAQARKILAFELRMQPHQESYFENLFSSTSSLPAGGGNNTLSKVNPDLIQLSRSDVVKLCQDYKCAEQDLFSFKKSIEDRGSYHTLKENIQSLLDDAKKKKVI